MRSRVNKRFSRSKNYPSKLLNDKFPSLLLIRIRFVSNTVHKHITSLSIEKIGPKLPLPLKYNDIFVNILTVTIESSHIKVVIWSVDKPRNVNVCSGTYFGLCLVHWMDGYSSLLPESIKSESIIQARWIRLTIPMFHFPNTHRNRS